MAVLAFADAPHARQMVFSPGGVLLVTVPGKVLIGFDHRAGKLTRFTDDLGTHLSKSHLRKVHRTFHPRATRTSTPSGTIA